MKRQAFFKSDKWTWENLREHEPPVVPELNGDTDTTYFDVIDDEKDKVENFATPRVSEAWWLLIGCMYRLIVQGLDFISLVHVTLLPPSPHPLPLHGTPLLLHLLSLPCPSLPSCPLSLYSLSFCIHLSFVNGRNLQATIFLS